MTQLDTTKSLPSQRLTHKEKIANDYEYYKNTANFFIGSATFTGVKNLSTDNTQTERDEISLLLGLYNNIIPASWFTHITKPIGKKEFLPTKVRPFNMLKTNIDYLISTYGKRPLLFTVTNEGQQAYNEFIEQKKQYTQTVIRQRFVQLVNGQEQDTTPEELIDQFSLNYRDALSSKAQSFMTKMINRFDIQEKLENLFKDYSIYGHPVAFKSIENDKLVYKTKDIRNVCFGHTETGYGEDADWVVEEEPISITAFADRYFDILDEPLWKKIDDDVPIGNRTVREALKTMKVGSNYVTLYHCYWKGFKKIQMVYGINEETGQPEEREEDEFYEATKDEYVEVKWISQIYRTTRVGSNFFIKMGEYPYAISNANSIGENKLPYNDITYAYKVDKVFSILKAGVAYLTLNMICHMTVEKMLAKHKGKIFLLDYAVVPKVDGWDEEKFIQYMEALGYAFINRQQLGVDKSFNQYTSIDMSMLSDIFQLKQLADSYVEDWDRMTGITRQAKGQNFASDQVGTTKASIIQSNITIDYFFQRFDHFTKRELQGILELSKFLTLGGYNDVIDKDEYGSELLQILPGELLEKLGVKMSNSSVELDKLNQAKQYAQTVNQQDPDAVIDIIITDNISQLKQVLNKISRKRQELAKQQQGMDMETQQAIDDAKMELMEFENRLGIERDDNEFEHEYELELLKGDIQLATAPQISSPEVIQKSGDAIRNIDDVVERSRDRMSKENIKKAELGFKEKELATKYQMAKEKNATDLKNKVVGERNKAKKK